MMNNEKVTMIETNRHHSSFMNQVSQSFWENFDPFLLT